MIISCAATTARIVSGRPFNINDNFNLCFQEMPKNRGVITGKAPIIMED